MTRKYERKNPHNEEQKGKTCVGPECTKPAVARGMCQSHYGQARRGKELHAVRWTRPDMQRESA